MPVTQYEVTMYKAGDMLYGKNSLNLKVLKINPDQSVDLQVLSPRSGTLYYYRSDNVPNNNWNRVPNDNILRNIDKNMYIQLKLEYGSSQRVEKGLSWWGNKWSPDTLVYGNPPYGYYKVPEDTKEIVPDKDLSEAKWRDNFNLGPEWKRVPNSYKWEKNGNLPNTYYGWRRETNYGPYKNRYAKRIVMLFEKSTKGTLESGNIQLKEIKMKEESANLLPIRMGYYRGPRQDNINPQNLAQLIALPSTHKFADPEVKDQNASTIKMGICMNWWSEDNYTYKKVTYKFISDYPELYKDESGNLSSNNHYFNKLGTYTIVVEGSLVGPSGKEYKTIEDFQFKLFDDTNATVPRIIEGNPDHKSYKYDMNKDITIFEHYPQFPNFTNNLDSSLHTVRAYLDYYKFTNEGYDVQLVDSRLPLTSNTRLHEDGQYNILVETIYDRNGKTAKTESLFMIDRRIPGIPTIIVNEDRYEGQFNTGKAPKTYLNAAIPTIECPPYCIADVKIYYKRFNSQEWRLYGDNPNSIPKALKKIGTYKIVAKSRKTTVPNGPDGIPDSSESVAIFKIKRKFTHSMKVYPDGSLIGKETDYAYYDKVIIDFADSSTTDTDVDEDWAEIDAGLNKLYRINNGSWRYYLESVFIYSNCSIECMSVDEDGFESYITRKDIVNIDESTPAQPIIQRFENGSITPIDPDEVETFNDGITVVLDATLINRE